MRKRQPTRQSRPSRPSGRNLLPWRIKQGRFGSNFQPGIKCRITANRVRDLDVRKVNWKYFYDANLSSLTQRGFLNLVVPLLAIRRVNKAVRHLVIGEFHGLRVPEEDFGSSIIGFSRFAARRGSYPGRMHMAVA